MLAIDISPEEVQSARMTPEHLQAAVDALNTDGVVVLNNVVDVSHLELLRRKMLEDLPAILAREDGPYNFNTQNVQQQPPPFPPYLFHDVLLNEMVIAVTRAVLGEGVQNAFYSGNTALPGKKRQPVHVDWGHLWPNMPVAHPPYALSINMPVVDMDASNGSTEIWPGTHRDTTKHIQDPDIKVPEEALAQWRHRTTPFQPTVALGSALIRDMRLWHAGMPNHTDTPRPMIAMLHFTSWFGLVEAIPFPKGTESFFEHPHLKTVAHFVEEPIDHIRHGHAFDLSG